MTSCHLWARKNVVSERVPEATMAFTYKNKKSGLSNHCIRSLSVQVNAFGCQLLKQQFKSCLSNWKFIPFLYNAGKMIFFSFFFVPKFRLLVINVNYLILLAITELSFPLSFKFILGLNHFLIYTFPP